MGLINRVVPAEGVLTETMAYADQLVRFVSPTSLATTKRQIAIDQLHDNIGSSVRRAQQLLDEMASQPDYTEAIRVFGTDENPDWSQPPRSMDLADSSEKSCLGDDTRGNSSDSLG